jgi:hypothetical protein
VTTTTPSTAAHQPHHSLFHWRRRIRLNYTAFGSLPTEARYAYVKFHFLCLPLNPSWSRKTHLDGSVPSISIGIQSSLYGFQVQETHLDGSVPSISIGIQSSLFGFQVQENASGRRIKQIPCHTLPQQTTSQPREQTTSN